MSLRLREDEATAAAEACAALAEEMTNTCADPKLRGCSCTCDPLSAREPETDPPTHGGTEGSARPDIDLCDSLPLPHSPSIASSAHCSFTHHAAPPRGSAQLGSTRLGSAMVCQTLFALPLGSEPQKKTKKHLKELHHSQRCHRKCRGKGGFGSLTSCAGFDHRPLMGVDVVRRQHRDRRISKLEFNGRKCVIAL